LYFVTDIGQYTNNIYFLNLMCLFVVLVAMLSGVSGKVQDFKGKLVRNILPVSLIADTEIGCQGKQVLLAERQNLVINNNFLFERSSFINWRIPITTLIR